ncbi:protein of unknown function [Hyphomicrobium sp. 1Nfss2.1]|uniref:hypothetical protein n=1 Tax=Hyphomicrobium sp. 1Nfss2.1 TaxID=3413936 RepID=UPI003C7B30ED
MSEVHDVPAGDAPNISKRLSDMMAACAALKVFAAAAHEGIEVDASALAFVHDQVIDGLRAVDAALSGGNAWALPAPTVEGDAFHA